VNSLVPPANGQVARVADVDHAQVALGSLGQREGAGHGGQGQQAPVGPARDAQLVHAAGDPGGQAAELPGMGRVADVVQRQAGEALAARAGLDADGGQVAREAGGAHRADPDVLVVAALEDAELAERARLRRVAHVDRPDADRRGAARGRAVAAQVGDVLVDPDVAVHAGSRVEVADQLGVAGPRLLLGGPRRRGPRGHQHRHRQEPADPAAHRPTSSRPPHRTIVPGSGRTRPAGAVRRAWGGLGADARAASYAG
jgi:hypothetical protein